MKISKYTNLRVAVWGILAVIWGMVVVGVIATSEPFVLGWIIILIPEALFIWRWVVNIKRYRRPEYRKMQEEARREWAEYKESAPERRKAEKEKQELYRRLREQDKQPVAAKLVSVRDTTGKNVMGAAARGLLGGMLFGTFGAAVGITSARREVVAQTATFAVKYKGGRRGTETVKVGSKRFEELAKLLVE